MSDCQKIYKAAVYVRLSREDGDVADARKVESNSISNQKSLILNYLKDKKDIKVVSIREDDGYSGVNFDRPAFKQMMEDVRDGKVDCIVVKDLSRFGREYIDTGRYIERLFPAMGVRFIAINDNYDSASMTDQANEIVIPFKNLINDAYCRDISIKIRSHLEVKRQNGDYVGSFCVYGYRKSSDDNNRLIPDEYAGKVVQDIFAWIKAGMSLDAISRKLNEMGIKSPMEYKRSNGEHYQSSFKKKDPAAWSPVAVRRIATNPVYTGTLIQGKRTTPNHKIKAVILKDVAKWAIVKNNHEALVSEREFEIIQRLLAKDMRTAPGRAEVYLLSGIAVCADCGALMTRRVTSSGGKQYAYYMCSANKKHKKCSPHRIRQDVMEERTAEAVKEIIGEFIQAEETIRKAGDIRDSRLDRRKQLDRIRACEADISRYDQMLVSLYEDYHEGIVCREDFGRIRISFEEKRKQCEQALYG